MSRKDEHPSLGVCAQEGCWYESWKVDAIHLFNALSSYHVPAPARKRGGKTVGLSPNPEGEDGHSGWPCSPGMIDDRALPWVGGAQRREGEAYSN